MENVIGFAGICLLAYRVRLGGDRGVIASQAAKGAVASAEKRHATAVDRSKDLLPVIESIQAAGVTSLCKIAASLNARGIPAARGGAWSAVQVKRVLECA